MEVVHPQEEFIHNVVKGKRTKRQRPLSPHAFPITTSSSSGGGCPSGGGEDQNLNLSSSSPTTSVDQFSVHSEEEEDMANCLILLAQGGHNNHQYKSKQVDDENGGGGLERICNRKFVNPTTNTSNKGSGLYVYECKTCNRCFPSFQALGGHRASHKRPNKAMVEEKKVSPSSSPFLQVEETHQFNETSLPSLTLQMGNSTHHFHNNTSNKSRVHECSICGSEFSSGQALGGHMRRHRASTTTMTADLSNQHHQEIITKKAKTVLTLDLNLPAPEEDRETNFLFNSKQQKLIFSSTSSLVDCHY